jgi:hypothetical protein
MRIASIIMAHKEPQQIERMIRRFDGFPFDFYIHLDKKTEAGPFLYLAGIPQVKFIRHRTKVKWGSPGFVTALISSMQEVLATEEQYDFIQVMSGQDYPIRPVSLIYDTLEKNRGRNFISYETDGGWWDHAIGRISRYHLNDLGFPGKYRLQFLLNALLPERKFPLPYQLYGGPRAMCMTLTADCAKYVADLIDSNRRLRRFIRLTWGPDEFLIPTLVMNSAFRSTVVNDNFYYIDWSRGGSNPKILTLEDYEALCRSGKLLARKFDIRVDEGILDKLDLLTVDG